MPVKIEKTETKLNCYSDYHPNLPYHAKQLGGRWNGQCWTYDVRDEHKVRELYINIYGTDGEEAVGDLVTLRVTYEKGAGKYHSGMFVGGRCIGRATGRDSGARLSEGVVTVEGCITSAGSRKNWSTYINSGSVFDIRDMPRKKAEEVIESGYDDNDNRISAEIIDNGTSVDKAALIEEKERLLKRLAQIEEILKATE